MKRLIQFGVIAILMSMSITACAQAAAKRICENPKFDKKVASTLSHTVDFMSPDELAKIKDQSFVLDTREQEEYDISHIPDAHYASFSDFDIDPLLSYLETRLSWYTVLSGIEAKKIGEKLQEAGFTKVYNLYGSLFEWANQDYPLENAAGTPTTEVHTYNKKWSQWVDDDGKIIKVW